MEKIGGNVNIVKKIVITGGIASGKTTVCRILKRERGVYQLDSDKVIHWLLSEDQPTIRQIVRVLGSKVLSDGKIDRTRVAAIVFADEKKLKALEEFLHPKLLEIVMQRYRRLLELGRYKFFFVEMALVQEKGKEAFFNNTVSVLCDEARARQRSALSKQEYEMRMKYQWPIEKKAVYADYIITNNGSMQELEKDVLDFFETLKTQENISQ